MKKLMTMVGAATMAFGLCAETADLIEASVDFANETAGEKYTFPADEDSGAQLWFDYESAEGTITEGDPNFLTLEADAPVYRTFAGVNLQTEPASMEQVDIAVAEERDGIVIDQKVKFSAFDAETEKIDVEAGAKIAVWVKAGEEDDTKGTLQITTAALNADTFEPEEQTVDTEIEVAVADMHQLKITTIKAAEIDGDVVPGFIIELNGEPIAKGDGLWPVVDPWDACLTDAAKALIAENKLFPSMVVYGSTGADTLVGVGYKGTGAIESIDVSGYVPPVTTYTLAVTEPENGTLETDPAAGQIEAGVTVTVTATPDEGYELESITVNGAPLAEGETEFVMPAENVTVAATFKEVASEPDPTKIDPEDIPADTKAGDIFKQIPTDLANVDAKKFAQWCQKDGNDVGEFGKNAKLDAFLLDCLNTDAAIDEAKKDFVIASIEFVDGEWVVLVKDEDAETTAYKNGFVKIIPAEELKDVAEEGVAEFFRAQLVAEPVE